VSPWENGDSRPICRALPPATVSSGVTQKWRKIGLLPAALASAALALPPWQLISEAQEQAPAAPAAAAKAKDPNSKAPLIHDTLVVGTTNFTETMPVPPRTMGMEVYSGAPVEGRQPVREFGGKQE